MRWTLGSLVNRLRDGRGRRPNRPTAGPVPSLEALEDRRLLSAAAPSPSSLLKTAPLLDSTTAVVAAVAPTKAAPPSGKAVAAPASNTPTASIVAATGATDSLDWQVEAVYRTMFASYLASVGYDATNPPAATAASTQPASTNAAAADAAPASQTPPPAKIADASADSGQPAAAAAANVSAVAATHQSQTTTTPDATDSASVQAPPTTLIASSSTPGNSSPQTQPPTATAAPVADVAAAPAAPAAADSTQTDDAAATPTATAGSGAASSGAAADTTADAVSWQAEDVYRVTFTDGSSLLMRVRVGVEGPTEAPVNGDSSAEAGQPSTNAARSDSGADPSASAVLVVEISVADDPATGAVSPPATDMTALRLTITPPTSSEAAGWILNVAPAPTADNAAGADGGQNASIPPLDFTLQPVAITGRSETGIAADSGTKLAGSSTPTALTGLGNGASPSSALPGGAGAAPASQADGGWSRSLTTVTAIADVVLADWSGREASSNADAAAGGAEVNRGADWQAGNAGQTAALAESARQIVLAGMLPTGDAAVVPASTAMPYALSGMANTPAGVGRFGAAAADKWVWIGGPVFAVGGVILPSLGLGRNDAPAGAASDGSLQAGIPIAEVVKDFTQSLTEIVRSIYRSVLGRLPADGEEQGWVGALLGGQSLEQLLPAFLGTADFSQRASALVAEGTPD
ncbi:MAG TPA: hypothetical protein VMS17_09530, partial [Gemmataceae bacterium]|nr:hypothetical protein [Gemmataceae bacterium]